MKILIKNMNTLKSGIVIFLTICKPFFNNATFLNIFKTLKKVYQLKKVQLWLLNQVIHQ